MPRSDEQELGPSLERRLRAALDRAQPRFSSPRYLVQRPRPWRLAPVALAVAITGVVVLSLSAAAGSVNPSVVVKRISTGIQPAPEPPAIPESTPTSKPAVAPAPLRSAAPAPEPSEQSEAGPTGPAARPSAEPSDDHSGESRSPSPSPDRDRG